MASSTTASRARGVHGLEALGGGDGLRVGVAAVGDELGQHRLGLGGGELAVDLELRERGEPGRLQLVGAVAREVVLDVDQDAGRVATGADGGDGQVVEAAVDRRPPRPRRRRRVPAAAATRPAALGGQHRHRRAHPAQPLGVGRERHEVGLGEVAVVVGLFLGPQRVGAPVVLVPVAGLLARRVSPASSSVDLARRLVLDGPPERAHRVEVLDLAARAEARRCRRGRTDTLASTRIEPSSILASQTPVATRMARSSLT